MDEQVETHATGFKKIRDEVTKTAACITAVLAALAAAQFFIVQWVVPYWTIATFIVGVIGLGFICREIWMQPLAGLFFAPFMLIGTIVLVGVVAWQYSAFAEAKAQVHGVQLARSSIAAVADSIDDSDNAETLAAKLRDIASEIQPVISVPQDTETDIRRVRLAILGTFALAIMSAAVCGWGAVWGGFTLFKVACGVPLEQITHPTAGTVEPPPPA